MKINPTRFILTLLVSVCLFSATFAQSEKERISKYVEQYKDLAIAEMIRTGVPASITLAQGVLETGFGQSDLALNANNHFGIKCKAEWKGETIIHDDDKKGECFRKYATVEDSYKDHSDFLRTRKNYAELFLLDPSDYNGWAYGLKKAGYATNPVYPQRLLKIIEENNLQQYTLLAIQRTKQTSPEVLTAETKVANEKEATVTLEKNTEAAIIIKQDNTVAVKSAPINVDNDLLALGQIPSYPAGIFSINSAKVMWASAGTSLLAIANNNSVSYSKLIDFNELGNKDILEKDQLIFLEKKSKKGASEIHIVSGNESLHDICQKEGVQLASLLEMNHLQKGMKPAVGEKIYLKTKTVTSPRLATSAVMQDSASMR